MSEENPFKAVARDGVKKAEEALIPPPPIPEAAPTAPAPAADEPEVASPEAKQELVEIAFSNGVTRKFGKSDTRIILDKSLTNPDEGRLILDNSDLQKLSQLKNLESLELVDSNIDDEGLKIIAGNFPNLRSLNLQGTKITDEGLRQNGRYLATLGSLTLHGTSITEKSRELLAEMQALSGTNEQNNPNLVVLSGHNPTNEDRNAATFRLTSQRAEILTGRATPAPAAPAEPTSEVKPAPAAAPTSPAVAEAPAAPAEPPAEVKPAPAAAPTAPAVAETAPSPVEPTAPATPTVPQPELNLEEIKAAIEAEAQKTAGFADLSPEDKVAATKLAANAYLAKNFKDRTDIPQLKSQIHAQIDAELEASKTQQEQEQASIAVREQYVSAVGSYVGNSGAEFVNKVTKGTVDEDNENAHTCEYFARYAQKQAGVGELSDSKAGWVMFQRLEAEMNGSWRDAENNMSSLKPGDTLIFDRGENSIPADKSTYPAVLKALNDGKLDDALKAGGIKDATGHLAIVSSVTELENGQIGITTIEANRGGSDAVEEHAYVYDPSNGSLTHQSAEADKSKHRLLGYIDLEAQAKAKGINLAEKLGVAEAASLSRSFEVAEEANQADIPAAPKITHFAYLRHADREAGGEQRLNENGWKQARAIVEPLKQMEPDVIYCSPLPRAMETIRPYLEATGKKAIILPELEEVDWDKNGHTLKQGGEIKLSEEDKKYFEFMDNSEYMAIFNEKSPFDDGATIPQANFSYDNENNEGAEIMADIAATRILSAHADTGDKVLIVGHGTAGKLFVEKASGDLSPGLEHTQLNLLEQKEGENVTYVGNGYAQAITASMQKARDVQQPTTAVQAATAAAAEYESDPFYQKSLENFKQQDLSAMTQEEFAGKYAEFMKGLAGRAVDPNGDGKISFEELKQMQEDIKNKGATDFIGLADADDEKLRAFVDKNPDLSKINASIDAFASETAATAFSQARAKVSPEGQLATALYTAQKEAMAAGGFTQNIQENDVHVKTIQTALGIEATGQYDEATKQAVVQYQTKIGLNPQERDGWAGKDTLSSLAAEKAALAEGKSAEEALKAAKEAYGNYPKQEAAISNNAGNTERVTAPVPPSVGSGDNQPYARATPVKGNSAGNYSSNPGAAAEQVLSYDLQYLGIRSPEQLAKAIPGSVGQAPNGEWGIDNSKVAQASISKAKDKIDGIGLFNKNDGIITERELAKAVNRGSDAVKILGMHGVTPEQLLSSGRSNGQENSRSQQSDDRHEAQQERRRPLKELGQKIFGKKENLRDADDDDKRCAPSAKCDDHKPKHKHK